MGYKVLESFRDAHTRVVHIAGTEYPDNAGAERIKTLQSLGYIESDKPEKAVKHNTAADIKAALDEKGIEYPSSANKAELLALLEG